jgi:hypothetical protein
MRAPTINGILGGVLIACCFAASISPRIDPDLFHGLTLAREFVRTGVLPTHDLFAYTPTHPVVPHHEWLAASLAYLVVEQFDAPGLTVLALGLESVLVVSVLSIARWQGARLPTLCLLAPLGMVLLAPGLTTLRAQVYSLLFTAAVLAGLQLDRLGRRWWIGPFLLLHVIWLNLHGGFVIGLGLLALHAAEQRMRGRPVRHLLATVAAACALVPVNPYGVMYVRYLWDALTMDRALIGEWRPLGDGYPVAFVVFGLSLVVTMYGVAKRGMRDAAGLLLVLGAAAMALRHQRHVSIYAVVWLAQVPPLVTRTRLGELLERWWTLAPRRTAVALIVAIVWAASRAGAVAPWRLDVVTRPEVGPVAFPAGAVAYLEANRFRGNLMTPFDVGAFVSWHLYPDVRVSLDGRYEVAFSHALLVEHVVFYGALPGWQDVRAKYPPDAVLTPATAPIADAMQNEAAWSLVYVDDAYRIYARPGLVLPPIDRRGRTPEGSFP